MLTSVRNCIFASTILISLITHLLFTNLYTNNSSFKTLLSPYKDKNSPYNVTLNTNDAACKAVGAAGTTGGNLDYNYNLVNNKWVIKDIKMVDAKMQFLTDVSMNNLQETTTTTGGKTFVTTTRYSDIAVVNIIAHEALHANLIRTSIKQENEGGSHNLFNTEINGVIKILSEYVSDNKLSYTKSQIYELAIGGSQKSTLFKNYIKKLAKKNGTTVAAEKDAYDIRLSGMMHESNTAEKVTQKKDASTLTN